MKSAYCAQQRRSHDDFAPPEGVAQITDEAAARQSADVKESLSHGQEILAIADEIPFGSDRMPKWDFVDPFAASASASASEVANLLLGEVGENVGRVGEEEAASVEGILAG